MKMPFLVGGMGLFLSVSLLSPQPASAYEAATTAAGLLQQGALASRLHQVLINAFGRSLGLFEPLALEMANTSTDAKLLWQRLMLLDPAQGYRPGTRGDQSALGWLSAGAVLAETPAEEGRHHYLLPTTGRGLDDRKGLSGTAQVLSSALDSGEGRTGVRGLGTGMAFDHTGMPSTAWLFSEQNDLSVTRFVDWISKSATLATPAARDSALARALLCAGAVAAVLIDAGEPAHVRNDFRGAHESDALNYERHVAQRHGREGLPASLKPVSRPSLLAFIAAPDGEGLADRTHRRFFSEGSVPADVPLAPAQSTVEVLENAREGLAFPLPNLPRLSIASDDRVKYLRLEGRRALAYMRLPNRLHFFLDEKVFEDTARTVLPEIEAYVAGMLNHLTRVELLPTISNGQVSVGAKGLAGPISNGQLEIVWEDENGQRHALGETIAVTDSEALAAVHIAVPAAASRVVAVLRGNDIAGPVAAVGQSSAGNP
jgi:hypothetical protein